MAPKMNPSPFRQLYRVIGNTDELSVVYRFVLKKFTRQPFWMGGAIGLRRVLWTDGRRARTEDPETFASGGIYLWGVENRPLYIGKTRGSFRSRFSRYIWDTESQCNLAREYGDALIVRGMRGFPSKTSERRSQVRLQGAIRFAEEGVGKVWFGLLPHDNKAEIETLEPSLISVAKAWNHTHGFRPLLNVEFNKV